MLLSAGSGDVPAGLTGVFEAIITARQPRSALNWLRNGAGAGLLADVAAGRLAATHEALDAHPHQRAADYLRHMLTAGGMLPYRDEELARTEQWLATLLEGTGDPATRGWCSHLRLAGDAAAAPQRGRPRPRSSPRTPAIRSAPPQASWPGWPAGPSTGQLPSR